MSDDNSDIDGSDEVEIDGTSGFSTNLEKADLDDEESNQGLFDDLLSEPIFENKEVLRPSYTPHELPHRSDQINKMATILVAALRAKRRRTSHHLREDRDRQNRKREIRQQGTRDLAEVQRPV